MKGSYSYDPLIYLVRVPGGTAMYKNQLQARKPAEENPPGFEPGTRGLRGPCSTVELWVLVVLRGEDSNSYSKGQNLASCR